MENNMNQQPKQHRRRSRRRMGSSCAGTALYMIVVLGISVVLSLVAVFVANDVFAFVKDDAIISVSVPENTDVASLSSTLDETGVIHYGAVFKLYVSLKGDNESVLAGTYALNPNMDYGQIINALTNYTNTETTKITIPEGYTTMQIRQLLLDEHVCTEEAADKAFNRYSFKHSFLQDEKPVEEGWLEGYLFPDTYEIYKGNATVVDTLNKMLNNFEEKYDEEIEEGAENLGRSMHDIVVVASLLEREAMHDDEYARIAGVIYNRLNNADSFPYLQVDASVLYGLGRTGGKLSQQDMETDTPYNLYIKQGLPPGPICNPGYKSLYAAAHPEEHNYFYYVAMPDGSHLFANSYEEHEANIAASNQAQAEAAANTEGGGESE